MQAKLRSKTHRCLVGFIIVMLSTPLLFIVNLPCYTVWNYGYIITLVKEEEDKSLINKYRLYDNWNKNGELSIIQKIDIHLFDVNYVLGCATTLFTYLYLLAPF